LPVNPAGEFPAGALAIRFQGTNSLLDYRITGSLQQQGTRVLEGLLTNNLVAAGRLTAETNGLTLRLPVDATYRFQLDSDLGPVDFTTKFSGQIVAVAAAAPPAPEVTFTPPAAAGGPLVLAWPAGFVLQTTTNLTGTNWTTLPVASPYAAPTAGPGEYFQVAPAPPAAL
jgi:hypothetical protein